MRTIDAKKVKTEAEKLIRSCLVNPDPDVTKALRDLSDGSLEGYAAGLIAQNNKIASEKGYFACQDTGQALLYVTLGDDVFCSGLRAALDAAVKDAYAPARKSVADPLTRINTGDNTPPIIVTELVSGDGLTINFMAKGAGSENMTKLYMLKPADGEIGIIDGIVRAVKDGGKNACPPLIVGVGIGGVSETACMLAKKALLRKLGSPSPRADARRIEERALKKINELGIGVAAFGGKTTALAVHAEIAPTHIGMLPIAVNLQCHSSRHGTVTL